MLLLAPARWEPRVDSLCVLRQTSVPGPWHPTLLPSLQMPLATRLLTVQVADLAVLDCWKVTSKWWGPG